MRQVFISRIHLKEHLSEIWRLIFPCIQCRKVEPFWIHSSISPVNQPDFALGIQDQVARCDVIVCDGVLVENKR